MGMVPVWQDYAEDKRSKIDRALEQADEDTRRGVRQAILEIEHVALRRRFVDFVLHNIQPSYFRTEASGLTNAAGSVDP